MHHNNWSAEISAKYFFHSALPNGHRGILGTEVLRIQQTASALFQGALDMCYSFKEPFVAQNHTGMFR